MPYELGTRAIVVRFTMPRLSNIAHFQSQRKAAVLCANSPRAPAAGRHVNEWRVFGPIWTLADVSGRIARRCGVHVPGDSALHVLQQVVL